MLIVETFVGQRDIIPGMVAFPIVGGLVSRCSDPGRGCLRPWPVGLAVCGRDRYSPSGEGLFGYIVFQALDWREEVSRSRETASVCEGEGVPGVGFEGGTVAGVPGNLAEGEGAAIVLARVPRVGGMYTGRGRVRGFRLE